MLKIALLTLTMTAEGATAEIDCPSTCVNDNCARCSPETGELLRNARRPFTVWKVAHRTRHRQWSAGKFCGFSNENRVAPPPRSVPARPGNPVHVRFRGRSNENEPPISNENAVPGNTHSK